MAFITQIHKSRNDRGHLRPSGRGMGRGNGEGGYTNGKVARFIFNGFQWLKPTRFNSDHYPLSTLEDKSIQNALFQEKPSWPDLTKQTRLVCRMSLQAKIALLISDSSLIEPRWRGRNLFSLWTPGSSQCIRKDYAENHKIFTERKPAIELFRQVSGWKVRICIAGELEALNLLKMYPHVGHH